MNTSRKRQLGVSLIEALVAFGVMAFGMMAVVGMQATLRTNGDLARQRAEAVRIAQDAIEEWRGFTTLVTTTDRMAYADLTTDSTPITGTNATYVLTRQVNDDAPVSGTVTPQRRTLVVDVAWDDRNGQAQSIRLASSIVGLEPEVGASLVLAANPDPVVTPLGRHRGIPRTAVALSIGTSGYVPPGQAGSSRIAWVFNNVDASITLCTTTGAISGDLLFSASAPVCGTERALLISGAVRFATDVDPAASSNSVANPSGPEVAFGLNVVQTISGGGTQNITCYQEVLVDDQRQFYCAIPISGTTPTWDGAFAFTSPLPIAGDVGTSAADQYKVCRYHAEASYTAVAAAKLSQNFVIIKAGNGSSPYACPTTSTPRTWAHQPS